MPILCPLQENTVAVNKGPILFIEAANDDLEVLRGRRMSDDVVMITTERAYTSPIWYTP